jgi:pseudoazurin
MFKLKFVLSLFLVVTAPILYGAEHVVEALSTDSSGETMVFEPGYLKIELGDTVIFKPSDPSHNAESIFLPPSASSFMTPMGKDVAITFSEEGVYLYKCTPHLVLGMVGVIQVGRAINKGEALSEWDSIEPSIAMNKDRMKTYLQQID